MEFRLINWLPTKERGNQYINAMTFKFVDNNCTFYEFALHCRIDTRNHYDFLGLLLYYHYYYYYPQYYFTKLF